MVPNTWYDLPQHLSQLAYALASIRRGLEQRRALGHNEVGTKYVTEEGYNGFSRWQIGIGHFRFRNMTLRYHISSEIS